MKIYIFGSLSKICLFKKDKINRLSGSDVCLLGDKDIFPKIGPFPVY